ncbi:unnamed protein product [Nezara viridula]|uniref:Gustatory receptor n=1 Tax=Nezara viridula TaxID=85310 RepID=A0A9P0MRT1_NEZVI|nr:unnamed protein product [Nezara viridula]
MENLEVSLRRMIIYNSFYSIADQVSGTTFLLASAIGHLKYIRDNRQLLRMFDRLMSLRRNIEDYFGPQILALTASSFVTSVLLCFWMTTNSLGTLRVRSFDTRTRSGVVFSISMVDEIPELGHIRDFDWHCFASKSISAITSVLASAIAHLKHIRENKVLLRKFEHLVFLRRTIEEYFGLQILALIATSFVSAGFLQGSSRLRTVNSRIRCAVVLSVQVVEEIPGTDFCNWFTFGIRHLSPQEHQREQGALETVRAVGIPPQNYRRIFRSSNPGFDRDITCISCGSCLLDSYSED